MDSIQSSDISWDNSQWFFTKEKIEELVNKVTISNVQQIAKELLTQNLITCRGLFCQAIMKSQIESPEFTNLYASLAAIINSEYPDVGLLLVKRVALQFKEASKQINNKKTLEDMSKFVAHLVNQLVVFESLALDVILTLFMNPSSDNIEAAVKFCIECGSALQGSVPDKFDQIFDEFNHFLREGVVEKRVQVKIVKLFAIRKSKFVKYPDIIDELDLVDACDQITHGVSLLHDIDPENSVDEFKPDGQLDDDNDDDEVLSQPFN